MTQYGILSSPIPKILHFCWIPTLENIPEERAVNIDKWQIINPDYKVELWDEARIEKEMEQEFLDEYKKLASYVKKSDFARCWFLARYGGTYVDVDLIPFRSLSDFMGDEFCYGRLHKGQKEPVNYNSYDFIWTREYRRIDKDGHAVANGIVSTKPSKFWTNFLRSRFKHRDKPVLKSYGPHALTHYLRPRIKKQKAIVIPPTYFLWEKLFFGEPAPFCVSEHPAENTWGDKTKEKWWETDGNENTIDNYKVRRAKSGSVN